MFDETLYTPEVETLGEWERLDRMRSDLPQSEGQSSSSVTKMGIRQFLPACMGEGHRDFVSLSNKIVLTTQHFKLQESFSSRIKGENLLKFHFQTSGKSQSLFTNKTQIDLVGSVAALLSQPKGVDEGEYYLGGHTEQSVTISCNPKFLQDEFEIDASDLPSCLAGIMENPDKNFYIQKFELPAAAEPILSNLIQTATPTGGLIRLFYEAKVYELLWVVINHLRNIEEFQKTPVKLSKKNFDGIKHIKELIDSDCSTRLTVETVCKIAGINRNKLYYGFQQVYGVCFSEYCLRKRLETAKLMLLDSDASITDIAYDVGYSQQSTFSSAFKRMFGVSPREMRLGSNTLN